MTKQSNDRTGADVVQFRTDAVRFPRRDGAGGKITVPWSRVMIRGAKLVAFDAHGDALPVSDATKNALCRSTDAIERLNHLRASMIQRQCRRGTLDETVHFTRPGASARRTLLHAIVIAVLLSVVVAAVCLMMVLPGGLLDHPYLAVLVGYCLPIAVYLLHHVRRHRKPDVVTACRISRDGLHATRRDGSEVRLPWCRVRGIRSDGTIEGVSEDGAAIMLVPAGQGLLGRPVATCWFRSLFVPLAEASGLEPRARLRQEIMSLFRRLCVFWAAAGVMAFFVLRLPGAAPHLSLMETVAYSLGICAMGPFLLGWYWCMSRLEERAERKRRRARPL